MRYVTIKHVVVPAERERDRKRGEERLGLVVADKLTNTCETVEPYECRSFNVCSPNSLYLSRVDCRNRVLKNCKPSCLGIYQEYLTWTIFSRLHHAGRVAQSCNLKIGSR